MPSFRNGGSGQMAFSGAGSDEQASGTSALRSAHRGPEPDPELPEAVWERLATRATRVQSRPDGSIIDRVFFDADDFPEAERAATYQHLIASTARMTPLADPIRLRAAYYTLGAARICLFDNIPYRFERSSAKAAFDRADRIAIQHLHRGDAVGNFDGVPAHLPEGSIYGIDFARPTTIVEHRPVRLVLLGLERRAAAAAIPTLEDVHGLVLDRAQARPYLRELYALVPRLDELPTREAPGVVASLLSALGRCFPTGGPREPQDTDDRLAARRRLAVAHMEAMLADPGLSPASIATALGLSRSALFRIFEPDGGVQRALLDLRLRRAAVLLTLPSGSATPAQVAAACGFSSPEHFSRQFSKRFGVSPSRYRDPVAPG